ncbi:proteasome subunit beta type-6-like [Micropterus salmoides]|uniref:proteasome subunit beta type-6-like n=1 Tax=Micropterus salmoides TaxID=27706 RepID=UPI0018EB1005|nr:proteasome subunit beta type-6-like [Micropterus salmoides]
MSPDLKPIEHLWDVLKQKAEEPKVSNIHQLRVLRAYWWDVGEAAGVGGGSGSTYIYGFMDSNYKPGLSKDQCLELTAAALSLAGERRLQRRRGQMASISEEGVERRVILGNQLPKYPHTKHVNVHFVVIIKVSVCPCPVLLKQTSTVLWVQD